jgi:hypothetical protein
MSDDSYRLNAEYKDRINGEILIAANDFLSGRLGVIAVSRKLSHYRSIVEQARPDLAVALITFVAVDSETDALPLGPVRQMWHPSTAEIEDQKIKEAQEHYQKYIRDACDEIIQLLS